MATQTLRFGDGIDSQERLPNWAHRIAKSDGSPGKNHHVRHLVLPPDCQIRWFTGQEPPYLRSTDWIWRSRLSACVRVDARKLIVYNESGACCRRED
jgi:hypothetical protein